MPSPVRHTHHGHPHGLLAGWLRDYVRATRGTELSIDCRLNIFPSGATQCDLVVTRTPPNLLPVQAAVWQLDFPGVGLPPLPTPLPGGAMLWANNGAALPVVVLGSDETLVQSFNLPPAGSATWTVQLFALPLGGVLGGAGPGQCSGISEFAASPALWFSY